MHLKKSIRLVFSLLLVGVWISSCDSNSNQESQTTQKDKEDAELSLSNLKNEENTPEVGILELAAQRQELQEFTTAASVVGLHQILDEREGQFTIFAPTDEAFRAAGISIDREDTRQHQQLKDLLLQHVVSQHTVSETWIDETMYHSLNRGTITIKMQDSVAYANEAKIIAADIEDEGGALHIIDKVLEPNPEKETIQ